MEDADDEAKSKDKDQGLKRDDAPLQNVEGSATLEKRSSMKKRVGGGRWPHVIWPRNVVPRPVRQSWWDLMIAGLIHDSAAKHDLHSGQGYRTVQWASFNLSGSFPASPHHLHPHSTLASSSPVHHLLQKHRRLHHRATYASCVSWWSHPWNSLQFDDPSHRPPNPALSDNEIVCVWQRGVGPTFRA